MSRHQGSSSKGKSSGRGQQKSGANQSSRGGSSQQGKSYARGNSPLRKNSFSASKPQVEKKAAPKKSNPNEIRLNKYIANSGICSRREADEHIAIGLVSVNGQVVTEMGYKVKLEDEVRYDGRRVNPEKKAYVLLNKPKGFATTTAEGKGRTVMDLVANATSSRIKPIGRLGRNSKGLLLFTNDEAIVKKFTNSKHGVPRLFHVELNKNLKIDDLKKIRDGFKVDGKLIAVEEISYIDGASKKEIGLKIKNTGNTIIRTIFDELKYDIISLDCVAIGHLTKKDIPRGHWKHLTEQELNTLKML
ncbi:MAG: pseudouridylate synthase [Xanthomarina sp.]|uniref:rRNA pseudouridine synthase n=1 Tax=Xanthomarina gelatinilytica TaxID=1137281 RepID=A0A3C0F7M3_9FLAO|nr:pseudouridine synthase [Xanthomarina sp.]MDX1316884.1 S4 domain-containing protein [Xanthomarina gelatinilytica]MAL23242.1 pseudouridylate synthase [Xanthomarina sp.]MBF60687.1 pseudouridylate synthase [Xanthomarina sp.]HAI19531.1 rRNA pseudouridine synthase [Xanthomarina gelatinilytica]HCY82727.1 rRNA pseudouridine synthase [Xanthomarina gelatinilytica]|tara:strand:+ start:1401 stop:2309 length:909 start_codon:yes stop_codon:yes gene_type:complete